MFLWTIEQAAYALYWPVYPCNIAKKCIVRVMRYFVTKQQTKPWHPNMVASDILAIDFEYLFNKGIRCAAFDVDGTITLSGSDTVDNTKACKLVKNLDKAGIQKRYLASNSDRSFAKMIKQLDGFKVIQPLHHKGKPSKVFYRELIKQSGLEPSQIVMIGDRALQDVWAPRRMGIMTIQVELHPDDAGKGDKLIGRHIWQRLLLRRKR